MTSPTDLLDLDIWMAERADGRVYAYTHEEPRFLTASGPVEMVLAECRQALCLYAQTAGHDLRFRLAPSPRPAGLPVPAEALPAPHEGGSRVVGRIAVSGLGAPGGPDLLAGDALAGFLSRARALPRPPRRGRPAAPPR